MKLTKVLVGNIATVLAITATIVCGNALAAQYSQTYNFSRPEFIPTGNMVDGREYVNIEMAGTQKNLSTPGAPTLPLKISNLLIGQNEKVVSVDVSTSDLIELNGEHLIDYTRESIPFSFVGPITETQPDSVIYGNDTIYPSSIISGNTTGYLHGSTIVQTAVNPVIYNPVSGKVSYYKQITVIVNTENTSTLMAPAAGERKVNRNLPSDREQILSIIDNDNQADSLLNEFSLAAPQSFDRQFLIITTSEMVSAFQVLANHRASEIGGGFTTHIETIENILANYEGVDNAEKVRNYVIESYLNHGTTYLILGGDADGTQEEQVIPTRGVDITKGSKHDDYLPSDLYFGCLDGTWNYDNDELWGEYNDGIDGGDIDWLSEVFVGRIAADNAQEASNQIAKIIEHDTNPHTQFKTLMVGEKLDNNPTWGADKMDYLTGFIGSLPYDTLYDKTSTNESWEKSEIIDLINSDEYFWINHLGHSSNTYNMKFRNDDVASMTNNKYMFIYTQGCYAGAFDNRNSGFNYITSDSISEELTVGFSDRGAFGMISNSRYGWYCYGTSTNCASNLTHKNFLISVFENGNSRIGEAHQIAKTYPGISRWDKFDTTLFGDPVSKINDIKGACSEYSATNDQHVAANRAYKQSSGWWWTAATTYYANGSDEELGTSGATTTTLAETSENYFTTGSCPAVVKTAPVVNIDIVNARAFCVELTGTASDEDGDYFRVEIKIDDNGWQPVSGNKEWSAIIDGLSPGETHTVSARAYDVGGRYSDVAGPVSFTNHGETPVISDPKIYVQYAVITISGNVTDVDGDISGIDVKIGNEDWKPSSEECTGSNCNIYHQQFGFAQGEYDIYVRAYDQEGNYTDEIFVDKAIIEEQHPPTITESHITREYYDGQYILKSTIADEDGDFYKCEFQLDDGEWQECFLGWFYDSYAVLGRHDDLGLGEHTVQKRITDTALHVAYSEVVTFEVVAKVAPEITALNALVNADLSLNIKGYARDIDGDVQRVEYSIDSTENWLLAYDVEDGNAYGNFNWETQTAPISKGVHTVYARVIDKTDQVSEIFGPIEITVDDPFAPTCNIEGIRFIKGEDGNNDYYQIYGVVNDENNNLEKVASKFDYNDYWGGGQYFDNGNNGEVNYEINIWPKAGQRTVQVKAVDYTDLETLCGSISFTVGNAPVIDSVNTSVNGTSVTISGTASDADNNIESVKVSVDNMGWITASGTTNWSITLTDQTPGNHTIKVIATDTDELISEELQGSFYIEELTHICYMATNNEHESANRAHSEESTSGWWWSQTTVTTWYAIGSEDNLGTNGSTTTTLVEYLDNPGHYVAEECPAEPVAPVISNVSPSATGQSLTVTLNVTDANNDIETVVLQYAAGDTVSNCGNISGSQYSCSVSNHSVGTFSFVVVATDATNRSATSNSFSVEFIEQQEHAPVINSFSRTVNGTTVSITGNASDEDGDLQTVVVTGLVAPYTCESIDANGNFTCTISGLSAGDYNLYLTAKDAANNESTQAGPVSFTIEDGGECVTAVNNDHVAAGRAYIMYNILVYATGSDEYLGLGTATTTLEEESAGNWVISDCN